AVVVETVVDSGVEESAAGRATAEVEVVVLARPHFGPRAAVVLAVGLGVRVIGDRSGQEAGVGQGRRGDDRRAGDLPGVGVARRGMRDIARVGVVAVVLRV